MEEIKKKNDNKEVTVTMHSDEWVSLLSKNNDGKKFRSLVKLFKDVECSRITGDDNSYSQSRTVIDMAYLIEDSLHETPEEFEIAMAKIKDDVLFDVESSYKESMPREIPTMYKTVGSIQ